jgi:hypothetical protein
VGGTVTLKDVNQFDWQVLSSGIFKSDLPFRPKVQAEVVRLASGPTPVGLLQDPGRMFVEKPSWARSVEGDAADNSGQVDNERHGTIHIDYDLARSDGQVTIKLRNRPEEGNFSNVFLVVEETPRPSPGPVPVLRTAWDITTVGRELHLPQEYFDYAEECLAKFIALIAATARRTDFGKPGPAIPTWDPARYPNVEMYLREVNQIDPHAIPRNLLTRSALRRVRMAPPEGSMLLSRVNTPAADMAGGINSDRV